MNLSNTITQVILDMMEDNGRAEIQRNTLAQHLGCVPSQINYVISSRFTPERGYTVESRRGGGGYIKITKIDYDRSTLLMHVVNAIGDSLDEETCKANILNLYYQKLLNQSETKLLLAAGTENCYRHLEPSQRAKTRAGVIKQMLVSVLQNQGG